jgi:hypothetical protein
MSAIAAPLTSEEVITDGGIPEEIFDYADRALNYYVDQGVVKGIWVANLRQEWHTLQGLDR